MNLKCYSSNMGRDSYTQANPAKFKYMLLGGDVNGDCIGTFTKSCIAGL